MKQNGRVNALLVELLIVVLMFMLASTTLMEIFGAAKQYSRRAENRSQALLQVQNMAESLYAEQDISAALEEMGFVETDEGWTMNSGECVISVSCAEENTAGGRLRQMQWTALLEGEPLFVLPSVRYMMEEVQP